MASPLLEAGAIDGARGILINITGSSSLKLSEVNEASSLIQSAAHEDANIIFGAVLDEKMGEEVKITVIATGFRDQMPERRARMLTVEEEPVVSIPLASESMVSIPLVAAASWHQETISAPAPARFLSQDQDEEDGREEQCAGRTVPVNKSSFFMASALAAGANPLVAPPAMILDAEGPAEDAEGPAEMEPSPEPARPKFAELCEEPVSRPLRREYAPEYTASTRGPVEDQQRAPSPSPSFEAGEEDHRDLDTPAFMRRSQF